MNCFEARNGFAAFWRKTLEPRAAFLAHLKDCAGCDRAFRAFALTAPLLYAGTIPVQRATPSGPRAIRPASAIRRTGNSRRGLGARCAMAAAIVAAGFAAYLSAVMPRQTLDDALSNASETTSDLAGLEETLVSLNDFAR